MSSACAHDAGRTTDRELLVEGNDLTRRLLGAGEAAERS
jgi:hypothetical protein